jgi:cyclin-dependent kinase 8/11
MVDDWSQAIQHDVKRIYRAKRDRRDEAHRGVTLKYTILGVISSGTYSRVYKAQSKDEDGRFHAIKKFKPDKDGDIATYTGISQRAIREVAVGILRLSRCRL